MFNYNNVCHFVFSQKTGFVDYFERNPLSSGLSGNECGNQEYRTDGTAGYLHAVSSGTRGAGGGRLLVMIKRPVHPITDHEKGDSAGCARPS
jgi:hypothetical protein